MNKNTLLKLVIDFVKSQGIEWMKEFGTKVIKDCFNYILAELKKKESLETVSLATAGKFNMPYDVAIELVMYLKKQFKL